MAGGSQAVAALQPPAWPEGVSRSFAAVVADNGTEEGFNPGLISTFRGEPALRIAKQDILQLALPFQHALVGRFSYSRPPMEAVRKFFLSLGLKGECAVALLDSNHVLIRPTREEDYTRLFVRRTWFIKSSPMTFEVVIGFQSQQRDLNCACLGQFSRLAYSVFRKEDSG